MGRKKAIFKKKCATCGHEFDPGKHKQKLNCSPECLKKYSELHKQDRLEKSRNGVLSKYGVDHVSKIEGHSEKVKQTKKEKYGDENFNNREKARETILEQHGVENSMMVESIKKKSKQTKKEKYGDENFNNRKKAEETIFSKTGKKHHLQTEESMSKLKETNLKLHNVEYTLNLEKCRENLKKKNLETIGSEYYFSSNEFVDKMLNEKKEKIKKILDSQNLAFDVDKYIKLREKSDEDKLSCLKYTIQCNKCGNEFKTSFINKPIFCRKCYPIKTSSSIIQEELKQFLVELDVCFEENNKGVISPLEIDFYIPKHKLAIELNGNYWHSELAGGKNRKYHLNKTILCNKKEIKLIHIFEDEWVLKKEIVKSRLKNLLNKTSVKIFARKCVVVNIDNNQKSEFLNLNHIQGNSTDRVRIGLMFKNEIVSVMTFSKLRVALGGENKEGVYELSRFCSKLETNIVGGFNKLLSCFVKEYKPKKIITYADCRWSGVNKKDTVYDKAGFKFVSKTPPSFFHISKKDYCQRKHRFSMAKHLMLKKFGGDAIKTGWQLAQENGYDRIWDCGTLKFEKLIH